MNFKPLISAVLLALGTAFKTLFTNLTLKLEDYFVQRYLARQAPKTDADVAKANADAAAVLSQYAAYELGPNSEAQPKPKPPGT